MNTEELIANKQAKVAIIGMGYVGLPHAAEIAKAGFDVFGIDIKKERVDSINRGQSYISDVKSEDLAKFVESGKIKAYCDFEPLKESDIIIICVPTPLDEYKIPDISYIKNSVGEIAKRIKKGQLIILESTTYPGTTEEILLPMFEKTGLKCGVDFYLAFAPERIDPGNKMPFSEVPKVVGGITKECTKTAGLFYSQFLKQVHRVSSAKTAEMAKILENTFRLVNISMINELALLCGKMRINIWEVIEAAKTKPYGFMPFYPSSKIGGHCIPLDPFYLSYKAKEYNFEPRFIELAGEINEQMPHFTVVKVNYLLNKNKKPINGAKILVWGVAYKKDINDSRESAAYPVISELIKKGAAVDYFDPHVKELEIKGNIFAKEMENSGKELKSIGYSPEILKNYDLVLILTDHSGFDYEEIARNSNFVVDTRNAIKSREHKNVMH